VGLLGAAARRSASVVLALWLAGCAHTAPAVNVSAYAPALQLPAVGSTPFSGPTRGKVLLVTFLATWCFPCVGQLSSLEKEQEEHAARGFTVVAVGMDLEGAEVLEPFAREYQLHFPLLVADERIRNGRTAFGPISSLPSLFLFGRDGRLITAFAGFMRPADLHELIVQALEEAP
jgi:peroxiredoxin